MAYLMTVRGTNHVLSVQDGQTILDAALGAGLGDAEPVRLAWPRAK
jgi:hypothetical protein